MEDQEFFSNPRLGGFCKACVNSGLMGSGWGIVCDCQTRRDDEPLEYCNVCEGVGAVPDGKCGECNGFGWDNSWMSD